MTPKAVWIKTGSQAKIWPGESGLSTTVSQFNPRSNKIAIREKPFKLSTLGLTPPEPGTILAGSPDGRGTSLGATVGVPVVGDWVFVGTWSGSVSVRILVGVSLMLEKIRLVSVNHSYWVLDGVGTGVGVEVMNG